ncbi:MAG TPA: aminoacetone oxidase family FAD-binding enzyme [Planctomycetota bacterium]|nr:aminoacetone oxidase family FAD-binding enzyme [Planctomycetota bacterium]
MVVGAGAAGLLAGIFAARAGVRTLVVETRKEPGAKIRVSGGARCNVLPSKMQWDDFHTHGSMNSVRNLLQSWPLEAVREFFEIELGIPLKVEATGKVFPVSDDPREVVVKLLDALGRSGASLVGGLRIDAIQRGLEGERGAFQLAAEDGRSVLAERLCLATGGLSLPKTGSDGRGFEFARALGHGLSPLYPALVPLLAGEACWAELAGISLPVRLSVVREGKIAHARTGDFLFTHKGFSGPVALDVSWQFAAPDGAGATLEAAWLGESAPAWETLLTSGGRHTLSSVLREHLPRRLSDTLLARSGLAPESTLGALSREGRKALLRELNRCELAVSGNEGYRTAEVTDGGVQLSELRTATLESRQVGGLYFAGEIVDVCGRIGGFNFLWAWISGRKVGLAVASSQYERRSEA